MFEKELVANISPGDFQRSEIPLSRGWVKCVVFGGSEKMVTCSSAANRMVAGQ